MQILGNTLREIATEKAGIIKQNGIVVTSAQSIEALLAIATICEQRNARMIRIGAAGADQAQHEVADGRLPALSYWYELEGRQDGQQRFSVQAPNQTYEQLEIPLAGTHQIENATVALATLEELRKQGIAWSEVDLRRGFQTVNWPARIEIVGRKPTIIVDGAHNADSMQKLLQALQVTFSMQRLIVVLATNQDKDQAGIIQALAQANVIILTRVKSPRATPIETLRKICIEYAPQAEIFEESESYTAMQKAVELATEQDLICATGSLYLAGEVLRWAAARGDQGAKAEIEGIDHP
jgi:dihydrofolate synthase/folylpolyglutamate synthase